MELNHCKTTLANFGFSHTFMYAQLNMHVTKSKPEENMDTHIVGPHFN